MTRFFFIAFAVAALVGFANPQSASAQSEILGRWLPPEQDSVIEIYTCGELVCGRIAHLDEPLDDDGKPKIDTNNRDEALRGRPILGMELLDGFTRKNEGDYSGGRIYNPRDGKVYKAIMTLLADGTLKLRGYVGIPALGKTQIWSRPKN